MNDQVAGDAQSGPQENTLLAVEREVINVFGDQQQSEQCCGGKTADQRRGRCRGDHRRKLAGILAAEDRAHGAIEKILRWHDVELIGDFLADAIEIVGVFPDDVGDDFGGFHRQLVEPGET